FFQAEDGIRDFHVTGVQTCALQILRDVIDLEATYGGSMPETPAPRDDEDDEEEEKPKKSSDNDDEETEGEGQIEEEVDELALSQIGRASCRERVEVAVGSG